MREREELSRLLAKVRELEQQNSQLNREKNEVATKYQAVSLLLCSALHPPFGSRSCFCPAFPSQNSFPFTHPML